MFKSLQFLDPVVLELAGLDLTCLRCLERCRGQVEGPQGEESNEKGGGTTALRSRWEEDPL